MRRMPGTGSVLVRSHHVSSSQLPGAYGFAHALAGLNMCPTAHLLYLLHSEFRGRVSIAFDIEFGSQVPKPCP